MLINKSSLASLAGVCAVFPAISLAQASSYQLAQLDPIVVTGTLMPQTRGETLSSVTVIDEAELRRQQPRQFSELLRAQPGVDLTTNGSFGKNTSVFMRGTGSESTLLLVDGIPLRSATSGAPPWSTLPPQIMERVEIVRGPRSSLYGANAVGGVVQAFTRQPDEPEAWVQAGGGSHASHETSAGVSGREGRNRYHFSANHYDTEGAPVIEGGEDRGYRNTSGLARLSHELDNGGDVGLVMMRSQGNVEFLDGETDFRTQTIGLSLRAPLSEYWESEVQFSEARDEQETSDSFGDGFIDTRTRSARWVNRLYRGPHEFALGTELLEDSVDTNNDFEKDSRSNAALFGQALFDFGRTDLQFSLRGDDNEDYGRQDTGSVAVGFDADANHRFRLSYGTSFRAPTFNDLYFPGYGNPDLEPEEGETVELGLGGQYDLWFWDAAIYQTDVENLIVPAAGPGGVFAPFNVDDARIRGLELESGVQWGEWTAKAGASLIDPRNRETDNRIRRRTGKQVRVSLDRDLGQFSVGSTLAAQGYRFDDAANVDRLSGFATLDLRASWEFAKNWTTRLTIDNALDKEYATARQSAGTSYISAGRSAFLSVRYDIR